MNRYILIGFFIFFFFTQTFSQIWSNDEKFYKRLLKEAKELMRIDEYDEAMEILLQIDSMKPNDGIINYQIGECLFKSDKKNESLRYFGKAIYLSLEEDKIDNEVYYYLANIQHLNHNFNKAIENYEKYLSTLSKTDPEYNKIQFEIETCKYGKELAASPVVDSSTNLGSIVNSKYSDYSPFINADESVLIFTSRRDNTTGGLYDFDNKYFADIYITSKFEGEWMEPVNISPNINTVTHDETVGFSPDGTTLYIYKDENGGDIFTCEQEGEEWSFPIPLNKEINTKDAETSCSVNADGNFLYFASNRPGGQGGFDIYVSKKLPGEYGWGKPKNLGPTINTAKDEDAPFIHPDGKTLYFSSNGLKTIGGFDVFKTEMEDDGSWSKPQNLGFPINTSGDDIFFILSADGKHGYYTSNRAGGYGDKDLWMIIMPSLEYEVSLTVLKGTITDDATGAPIEAKIIVIDNELHEAVQVLNSNPATGKFLLILPPGRNYGLVIDNPNYLFHSENIFIAEQSSFEAMSKEIKLEKIEVGAEVVLNNIFFDTKKAILRQESLSELEKLFSLLSENPQIDIEISGHTDNVGLPVNNLRLSQERADAVVKYLTDKGIDKGRMVAKGYGALQPVASNDTPEGKQLNRRTVLKITYVNL